LVIPQGDRRAVLFTGGNQTAIGGPDRRHNASALFRAPLFFPGCFVPEPHRGIGTGSEKGVRLAWGEREGSDGPGMTFLAVIVSAGAGVPGEQAAVLSPGHDLPTVGGPGQGVHVFIRAIHIFYATDQDGTGIARMEAGGAPGRRFPEVNLALRSRGG